MGNIEREMIVKCAKAMAKMEIIPKNIRVKYISSDHKFVIFKMSGNAFIYNVDSDSVSVLHGSSEFRNWNY